MAQVPVTLTTAILLVVIAAGISAGAALLRTHQPVTIASPVPKYVEYLPALLLLMRLLETAGASHLLLAMSSVALVFTRLLHGVGVVQFAPRLCNIAAAIGTTMLVVLGACYGLAIEGQLP